MKPHCILVVKYVLPALRAKVAKELIDRGYRVKDAAEMLGLTQAAISQYISSKRGQKGISLIEKSDEAVKVVSELVEKIIRGEATVEDEVDYLCRVCEILRREGVLEEEKHAV